MIIESTSHTAPRSGDYILTPPCNGKIYQPKIGMEIGNSSEYQLYNVITDAARQVSLAQQPPERLQNMIKEFISLRGSNFGNIQELQSR